VNFSQANPQAKQTLKREVKKNQGVKPQSTDYQKQSRLLFGTPTSINAIFFGSILLSSRLKKTSRVFSLLYLSLCIFGFIPIFRHIMRHKLRFIYDSFSLVSTLALGFSIFKMNALFGVLYFALIVFVSLISPLIFIYAYQFKNDIRGPWDCPQIKQYHTL